MPTHVIIAAVAIVSAVVVLVLGQKKRVPTSPLTNPWYAPAGLSKSAMQRLTRQVEEALR